MARHIIIHVSVAGPGESAIIRIDESTPAEIETMLNQSKVDGTDLSTVQRSKQ